MALNNIQQTKINNLVNSLDERYINESDIATEWGDPTSDEKVPSEKLVKKYIDNSAGNTHRETQTRVLAPMSIYRVGNEEESFNIINYGDVGGDWEIIFDIYDIEDKAISIYDYYNDTNMFIDGRDDFLMFTHNDTDVFDNDSIGQQTLRPSTGYVRPAETLVETEPNPQQQSGYSEFNMPLKNIVVKIKYFDILYNEFTEVKVYQNNEVIYEMHLRGLFPYPAVEAMEGVAFTATAMETHTVFNNMETIYNEETDYISEIPLEKNCMAILDFDLSAFETIDFENGEVSYVGLDNNRQYDFFNYNGNIYMLTEFYETTEDMVAHIEENPIVGTDSHLRIIHTAYDGYIYTQISDNYIILTPDVRWYPYYLYYNLTNVTVSYEIKRGIKKVIGIEDIVTNWGQDDGSDEKVPSEKLMMDTIQSIRFSGDYNDLTNKPIMTNYVQKSNTTGLLKNDGTVDTNNYLTTHQNISGKEDVSNKVDAIDENSTNSEYPTAKAIFDYFGEIIRYGVNNDEDW